MPCPGWGRYCLQLILANGLMAALMLWLVPGINAWFAMDWHYRAMHLAILMSVAITTYFAALRLSGLRYKHFKAPAV